ncbi:polyprenyl synthetase family protein [Porticoccaceae bacterium]|nr:polyprenyl synthetase family protein [Porticoccaceae bacterium]MDA8651908.1 polyprenyl synthetase family protein [Porticoccaceae bacterium]
MSPTDSFQKGLAGLSEFDSLMLDEIPHPTNGLHEAARYHFQNPGKYFRARLALRSGQALNLALQDSLHWAASCELLHNASLIHDDISDASTKRRGQASINERFGQDTALCLGDWMVAKAFELAARNISHGGQLAALLARAMQDTCSGQTSDINQRKIAELQEWQQIAKNKTAPLLIAPLLGMAICANEKFAADNLKQLVEYCGLAYQGHNDIDDIVPSSHFSSDLNGRKPNLVISLYSNLETTKVSAFQKWYGSEDISSTKEWQKRIASSDAITQANELVDYWLSQAERLVPLMPVQLQSVVGDLVTSVKRPITDEFSGQLA